MCKYIRKLIFQPNFSPFETTIYVAMTCRIAIIFLHTIFSHGSGKLCKKAAILVHMNRILLYPSLKCSNALNSFTHVFYLRTTFIELKMKSNLIIYVPPSPVIFCQNVRKNGIDSHFVFRTLITLTMSDDDIMEYTSF